MPHHDPAGIRGCPGPLPSVLGSLGVDVYKCVGLLDDALTGGDRSVGLSTLEADSALSPSYCTWEVGDGGAPQLKAILSLFSPSAPVSSGQVTSMLPHAQHSLESGSRKPLSLPSSSYLSILTF